MGLAANYAANFDAVMASFGPQWRPGPIATFGVLFMYILPALGIVAFRIRRDTIIGETERFDPATGTFHYADRGVRRYVCGFMRHPVSNAAHIVYFMGGLVTCGLGCYAAITQLMVAFAGGTTTSFTFTSPV